MWKWQVKAKNGHFFGEHKLWGSKFFAYANISWRYFILHIFEKIGATSSGKFASILTDTPVKVRLLKEFSKVAMTNPCRGKFNRVTIFLC